MFYQKYRPQTFNEVFGNKKIIKSLRSGLKKGNLGHAFMFHGPRGTGKTSTARLLAKALACSNKSEDLEPCLNCSACKSIESGSYTDLIEIDAASNNSVDNIRQINERVGLSPTEGEIKFYIIDEVHMLSKGAFNALLKTLEEPPQNVYFVLATTEPGRVPDTIKSRCQQFEFQRAKVEDIVDKLKHIAEEEGWKIEEGGSQSSNGTVEKTENREKSHSEGGSVEPEESSQESEDNSTNNKDPSGPEDHQDDNSKKIITVPELKKIAEASKGGFRDAETLLEQVIVGGLDVGEVLNSVGLDFTIRFFDALLDDNLAGAIELVNELYSTGKDLESWNEEILFYLRQIILIQNSLDDLVELEDHMLELAEDQAQTIDDRFLLKALKVFNNSYEQLKLAYIPTLPLEAACLELSGGSSRGSGGSNNNGPKSSASKRQSSYRTSVEYTDTSTSSGSISKDSENTSYNPSSKGDEGEGLDSSTQNDAGSEIKQKKDFNWNDFIKEVENLKPTLVAALETCNYLGFQGETMVIQSSYEFYKDRLEMQNNKTIIIKALDKTAGTGHSFSCKVAKKDDQNLTDKNVEYVTMKSDDIPGPKKVSPEEDMNDLPDDDPAFVASPTTMNKKEQEKQKGSGNAVGDFSGDFEM